MKVAFTAGFYTPVEVVIKALFWTSVGSRQLIWTPQGPSRDPAVGNLARELNAALGQGHELLLLHATPHRSEYNLELDATLKALRESHPGSQFTVKRGIDPRSWQTVFSDLRTYLGLDSVERIPHADILLEHCGESRVICVSHCDEPSFATMFKHLGYQGPTFDQVATEVRMRSWSDVKKLEELPMPRGPLLYASNGFRTRVPKSVVEEFDGRMIANPTSLRVSLEFVQTIREQWRSVDLRRAVKEQRALMPAPSLKLGNVDLVARFLPCYQLGGDFYDWFITPDGRVAIVLCDIAGKGLGAALTAHQAQAIIRAAAKNGAGPKAITQILHDEMVRANKSLELFCGLLEPSSGRLTYSYSGHVLPVVWSAGGSTGFLAETSTLPGFAIPGYTHFDEAEVLLPGPSRLMLFSDGVSESDAGNQVITKFSSSVTLGIEQTADLLFAPFEGRTRTLEDDATLVIVDLGRGAS